MAQALVRYLCNQFTIVDGNTVPLFPGVFAIFGHGNVTCLSEALEASKDVLPTWRDRMSNPWHLRPSDSLRP
jgi:3D-(3,5/4)-trihydroxycyclohexane-1,2-dione acylhydrolase (decyclizing)